MNITELRAICGLGTIFTLRMLGIFMVLPVLTTYGIRLQGANVSLIGVAIGIYGFVQLFCQIPFGLLTDRLGCKPLIISGLLIFTIGSIIAALTNSIWGIIIGRALQGAGTITAAVMAMLSDLTREQHRTTAMAVIGVSVSIAFAIAIVLGPIITNIIGLSGLFFLIAVLTIVSILITLFIVPTSHHHKINRNVSIVSESIKNVITNKQLIKLNFGIFCLHTILMLSFITLPHMMTSASLLPVDQWKVYLVAILFSLATVVPCTIYAEMKQCIKTVFLCGITILLCSEIILLSAGTNKCIVFIGIQLFFVAFNIMEAIIPYFISKEAPAGLKGTAMGIYSTSQFSGVAFGGIIGGWLFQLRGAELIFLVGVSITLIWLLISTTINEPPYVISLRIDMPSKMSTSKKQQLVQILIAELYVIDVLLIPEENSAYIKVNKKQANSILLNKLEKLVASYDIT
ncbi:MFS transporter [Candidatus Palibaumannia cicadellinicola]|uniref:Putative transport protein n=1 Tax=Candidatus Palibaumannia cicadellinicola TaxID=186490 RepID=A0A0K2BL90_9GAMM|nr:MFS transporter [Candidatus Baumannia cicadellinicola]AKZ65823.1 Putative transport protein [Candidatus Baumannia cicadellinicola]